MNDLSNYSERLSTGKKINKPSEDPFGMINAMSYKVNINQIEQYTKNIDEANSQLSLTDTIMSSVSDALTRARELAVEASTGTQTAANRASIAQEIASLRDEIFRLSQTKFRDRYIFSGYKTDTQPFDASFNYVGDTNKINVLIDTDTTVAMNITGDEAFSYGGVTFIETLDDMYNALMNNDVTTIGNSITSIDNDLGQVANARADIGARMNYIDRVKTAHEDRSTTMKMLLSNTEDTDIAETVSELTKIQYALESLRASGAQVLTKSLLDFLG